MRPGARLAVSVLALGIVSSARADTATVLPVDSRCTLTVTLGMPFKRDSWRVSL